MHKSKASASSQPRLWRKGRKRGGGGNRGRTEGGGWVGGGRLEQGVGEGEERRGGGRKRGEQVCMSISSGLQLVGSKLVIIVTSAPQTCQQSPTPSQAVFAPYKYLLKRHSWTTALVGSTTNIHNCYLLIYNSEIQSQIFRTLLATETTVQKCG